MLGYLKILSSLFCFCKQRKCRFVPRPVPAHSRRETKNSRYFHWTPEFSALMWKNSTELVWDCVIVDHFKNIHGQQHIPLGIQVHRLNYGQYLHYSVMTTVDPAEHRDLLCEHPFSLIEPDEILEEKMTKSGQKIYYITEIIADNSLTRELFRYLTMEYHQLLKETQGRTPTDYRASILQNVFFLWDAS